MEDLSEEIARRGGDVGLGKDVLVKEEDTEMQRALEELEDVEVALFLARVGDSLTDVRIPAPRHAVPFPELAAFSKEGNTDWRGFVAAVSESFRPPDT